MPSSPSQKSIAVCRSAPTSVMWCTPWLWILRMKVILPERESWLSAIVGGAGGSAVASWPGCGGGRDSVHRRVRTRDGGGGGGLGPTGHKGGALPHANG